MTTSTKLSVSLPTDDVEFLDGLARDQTFGSRSAAVHHAILLLRQTQLRGGYESAWREWHESGDAAHWASTTADQARHAAR